jgi:hypothetical protein
MKSDFAVGIRGEAITHLAEPSANGFVSVKLAIDYEIEIAARVAERLSAILQTDDA